MNSAFTGSPSAAPEGAQVAFIQATGEISQSISGFQANTNYVITFSAIQRTNCCNSGGQDIQVYLDSTWLKTFHPSAVGYLEYSTDAFSTTAGSHTVKFVGVDPLHIGVTVFMDNVRINGSPKPGYGIQWLLTDQLGTPRMVFDESGNLANVKRHDYLPFGEEIAANVGSRTPTQGYSASDGVRQQFTSKERDNETGLDYFGARYYANLQGRFTTVDPLGASGKMTNPQTFNRYAYVWNNPLRLVDPTGMIADDKQEDYKPEFHSCIVGVDPGCTENRTLIGSVTIVDDGKPDTIVNQLSTMTIATSVTERPLLQQSGEGEPASVSDELQGGGFGWGFTGGVEAAGGIGVAGAGGNAGAFWGQFFDENGLATQGGGIQGGAEAYMLAGARAATPRAMVSAVDINDDEHAAVLGRSYGIGGGVFFTNAARPTEMAGPFETRQFNTPLVGVQYDRSGPVWVVSFTFGPTLGGSYWAGKTTAKTTSNIPLIFK